MYALYIPIFNTGLSLISRWPTKGQVCTPLYVITRLITLCVNIREAHFNPFLKVWPSGVGHKRARNINNHFRMKGSYSPYIISTWYRKYSAIQSWVYFFASELKDPIWHSLEWQIGSFSSEATICMYLAKTCTPYPHHYDSELLYSNLVIATI